MKENLKLADNHNCRHERFLPGLFPVSGSSKAAQASILPGIALNESLLD